jgi:hypothetical protein
MQNSNMATAPFRKKRPSVQIHNTSQAEFRASEK